MSLEQLKAFLEKVKGDTSLQEKLKAAGDADAVAAIAKETGFDISADDLKRAQPTQLSEEELLSAGITPGFVRLSIGLEHTDDIIADFEQALSKI